MPLWKLQAVEPGTCEGVAQGKGCRYIELWDPEEPPETRTHTVVSFDRVCAGHADDVVIDKMLWADGNWKDFDAYIQYQRNWFRWRNHQQWLMNHPTEPMPPQIAGFKDEPQTPGSAPPPPQAQIDAMNRVYAWNRRDNMAWGMVQGLAKTEGIDNPAMEFQGHGESRAMVVSGLGVSRERIQAVADIQFGPGRILTQ